MGYRHRETLPSVHADGMSVEALGLPESRAALMDRHFREWEITEGREEAVVRGWLRSPGRSTEVQLRGAKAQVYAVLWGLLRSLEG